MTYTTFSEDLFSTNRAPTDDELVTLTSLVAAYEHRVDAITMTIEKLETERNALLEAKAPLKRVLSSLRRFPDDILREIFVACLNPTSNPTMSRCEVPVLLTRISSTTRLVALTTPALWAAIHIPIVGGIKEEPRIPRLIEKAHSIMASRAAGVREWLLHRSGAMPLSISVHDIDSLDWKKNLAEEVIDIILMCRARWQDVRFSLMPESTKRLAAVVPTDTPLLRSLAVDEGSSIHPGRNLWAESDLFRAPSLQRISITLTTSQQKMAEYRVNWANITHLNIPGYVGSSSQQDYIESIACVLRQTTRLVEFSLTIAVLHQAIHIDDIRLPFLEVLVADERQNPFNVRTFPGIFAAIRAPGLASLRYTAWEEQKTPPPSLIVLLEHSSRLDELYLGVETKPEVLEQCLRLCPHLTKLRVASTAEHDTDAESKFLEKFVSDNIAECLCPQLEYFRWETMSHVYAEHMRAFITRKDGSVPHLKSWKLVVMPYVKVIHRAKGKHIRDHSISNEASGRLVRPYWTVPPNTYDCRLNGGLCTQYPDDTRWTSKFPTPIFMFLN